MSACVAVLAANFGWPRPAIFGTPKHPLKVPHCTATCTALSTLYSHDTKIRAVRTQKGMPTARIPETWLHINVLKLACSHAKAYPDLLYLVFLAERNISLLSSKKKWPTFCFFRTDGAD